MMIKPRWGFCLMVVACQPVETPQAVPPMERVFAHQTQEAFPDASPLSTYAVPGAFPLVKKEQAPAVLVSAQDHEGVRLVAQDFAEDLQRVSGNPVALISDLSEAPAEVIVVGSLDQSPLLQSLVDQGKLPVSGLSGAREKYHIQMVAEPFPGVDRALVIVGSDKRGAIYGQYDLSRHMGVSPWYWWADVPVKQRANIYVKPGLHTAGEPKVKYRGIFINDEAPALSGWAHEKFGGFNHVFYEHVYELILRLKGNYLWPAMWGRSLWDDDPLSAPLADTYGVVLGTTHHEPLMRSHVEWDRYGQGPWNYEKNPDSLRQFWRQGLERMGRQESIVSVGMRGDGDEPMTEGTAIALLEQIVADQRALIAEVTGQPAEATPQLWALYKEVQDYYDRGMRVPDDVTLLLCDDNWGNIRKLPPLPAPERAGGYGIYYHFDYVGGPRNYKWLNTTQISRTWEQMHMAYAYGAKEIWIVNVGDLKPMELPISFFLDYAWNPEAIQAADIPAYGQAWAREQFGPKHHQAIAHLLHRYTQYNSRRKPELLDPETYRLQYHREWERVVADWDILEAEADRIALEMPQAHQSAYFQLVQFPIQAGANLNRLYFTVAKNRRSARHGFSQANPMAQEAHALFARDSALTRDYHQLHEGKWNHLMAQTHIGYTYWQQPEEQTMPVVDSILLRQGAAWGLMIEGDTTPWPQPGRTPKLPVMESWADPAYYLEIFAQGTQPVDYTITTDAEGLVFSKTEGETQGAERIFVHVDWDRVPEGAGELTFTLAGEDIAIPVAVPVHKLATNSELPTPVLGQLALEAADYTHSVTGPAGVQFQEIPQLGRTHSAMQATPVTASVAVPGGDSPHLSYSIFLPETGDVALRAVFSPTLNFHNTQGLRYAVSIDDGPPQIINLHQHFSFQDWEEAVRTNTLVGVSEHPGLRAGEHTLRYWLVDAGLAVQRLEVYTTQAWPTYLGPPAFQTP